MKIAVLGGTGFMGYDFVKTLLENNHTPVVYCTSPVGLSNLARHNVEIKYLPYKSLAEERLPADFDFIINFAHPFTSRDNLSTSAQVDILINFFKKNLQDCSGLKLIHISSLSVYEPFMQKGEYKEDVKLKAFEPDSYAYNKFKLEKSIKKIPGIDYRLLIIRPTVVYGPFCKPWTDNILSAFNSGDIGFNDLGGLIQPVFVGDVSRFLSDRLSDFKPGVYNFGGSETISWMDYLNFFKKIVSHGDMVSYKINEDKKNSDLIQNVKELLRTINHDPSFIKIAKPFLEKIPGNVRDKLRESLAGSSGDFSTNQSGVSLNKQYTEPFFSEDRLVSMAKFKKEFPGFIFTDLESTRNIMNEYLLYRFTDKRYD